MKKARILLGAIAVVATVGSVLAFKTNKGHVVSYSICNTTNHECTVAAATTGFTLVLANPVFTANATTAANVTCENNDICGTLSFGNDF